jgi:type IV pilus assembly protein PilN
MIRINLIGEGKRPAAIRPARERVTGPTDWSQWALLGLLVLGLLVAGGHWLLLRSQAAERREQVAEAQKEVDELAPIIKEVEEFKVKQKELQRRVEVIKGLKANQKGPVRIMDEISRALPDLLWLDSMEVRERQITVTGRAFNTNAVASLIENLDRVAEFNEPVLRQTQQQGEIYTFMIVFDYSYAPPPTAEQQVAAAGG